MPTLLITGANRGIGLEFTRQYAADKWDVVACCRAPGKAAALQELAKAHPAIRIETLDVTNGASIAALADKMKDTPIDILLNNAGIYSGAGGETSAISGDKSQEFGSLDAAAWEQVLRVNTIAPIMVSEALVPQLQKGMGKKIINITSRMGSLTAMKPGSIAYRSSKAALNGAMRAIADTAQAIGLTIVNFHPGWVRTDMGSARADLTAEQSVISMRKVISALKSENNGQFLNYDGQIIPW